MSRRVEVTCTGILPEAYDCVASLIALNKKTEMPNEALHRTATPLRSMTAGELGRSPTRDLREWDGGGTRVTISANAPSFMKTDGLFYTLFQKLPTAFFETLGLPPETADLYTFDSVEVKALGFRIDGVFLPRTTEVPIYFVEVQFQKDVGFYARFFSEIFMYLDKAPLPNDWRGVVIYPRRSLDPATENQNARYREILESSRVQRFYLSELGETAQQLPGIGLMCLAVEPEIGSRARKVLAQARAQGGQFYEQVLELVEKTLMQRFPDLSQEELLTMMDIKLNDWKNSRIYREVKDEGKLEGKLESARNFLRLGVTPEVVAQAVGISLEEVQQLQQNQS